MKNQAYKDKVPLKMNRNLYTFLCRRMADWSVLPYFDLNQNFTEKDWGIVGLEFLFLSKDYCINRNYFPKELQETINEGKIDNLIIWAYHNIFAPKRMMLSCLKEQQVRMRIFASKLNNLNLPSCIGTRIYENFLYCFYTRRAAYLDYLYNEVLQLPF